MSLFELPASGAVSAEDGPSRPWFPWFRKVTDTCNALRQSGTTAQRPTVGLWIGRPYFDTTLGYEVFYDGSTWVGGSGGGGGAPTGAQYVTLATDATLTAERVLTAGAGISITDGGAGGPVTIASTVTAGAPAGAQYVTLATNASLSAERVLTAGAGISITDGGANGPVTVAATASYATAYVDFGATPGTRLTATVVDAAVTTSSIVLVSWGAVEPTDDNDPELSDITFFATPGTGSFDVTATCATDFSGSCRINYTVG